MTDSSNLNQSEYDTCSVQVTPIIDSSRGCRMVSGPTRRSTKGGWTPEEKYKGKNWKRIAECIPGRKDKKNDSQCQHRWLKVLNPNLNKGPWTKEEDDLLSELVKVILENDKPKWSKISKQLPGRIGKQCRERWHNHLNPTIRKTPWTREEELILVQAQRGKGNKWADIAKLLPGRTENNIKNHWNCSLKKRLEQFTNILFSGSESSFVSQSNTNMESQRPFQIKQAANSPQRDSLDLTLGPMNWRNTPSSTSSRIGEEETISSSLESDWSRSSSKAEISPQDEVKEIRERLRMAASTFKNTPSIISKRSSPASALKRRRQEDDSEEHSVSNSPSSNSIFVKRNTCAGSNPLERRLEFDFL